MLFKSSLATVVGAATFAAAANPDKPGINPDTSFDKRESGLLDHLHPTHSTRDYWGAGWIPQACKKTAQDNSLNPFDFTVFNVHYDDCSQPWIFCRHKDATSSEGSMIDLFGRVPVHMRQYIRQFIATPDLVPGRIAYAFDHGDVVFENPVTVAFMLHEFSHHMDSYALPQFQTPFSSSVQWQREYAKDSATITNYGRTNWGEDFADTAPDAIYDKVVPGGFGSLNPSWNSVFHQYATYQGYLGDQILPGGTCDMRFANSETVPKGNSAARVRMGAKPDTSIDSANITIIETNPKFDNVMWEHFEDKAE